MPHERWGTLSVRDHLDLEGMVANVLLYDRLVVPTPGSPEEEKRWRQKKWRPRLLRDTLQTMGDLAIQRPWNATRQAKYKSALESTRDVSFDADNLVQASVKNLPYHVTRLVLAQEQPIDLPAGVTRVDVVAAYNSAAKFRKAFSIVPSDAASAAILLRHTIAVPAVAKHPDALQTALGLSRDADFRDRRRDFYDWQAQLLEGKVAPAVIAAELRELVEGYNRCVEKASKKVKRKFAFVVGGVAVSLAGAVISMNPLPAVGALITFVSFTLNDGKPAIDAGRYKPAAMFHDAKKLFE